MVKPGDGPTQPPGTLKLTSAELAKFDGSDDSLPLYLAVKKTIFDVSKAKDMYGPGKSYHAFVGKDASRALGMSTTKLEHCVSDYSTLDVDQLQVLEQWYALYVKKYNIVGQLVDGEE